MDNWHVAGAATGELLEGAVTPWTDKFVTANWDTLLAAVQGRDDWMPLIRAEGKRGKVTLDAPLGCGTYGCVYATPATDAAEQPTVCKVSSDLSEAGFVRLTLQWLQKEPIELLPVGIVRYYAILDLPGTHRRRPISVIWREAADDVGRHDRGKDDYERRLYQEFSNYHEAYLTAARYVREQAMKPTWTQHLEQAAGYAHWAGNNVIWEDGIDWQRSSWRRKPADAFFFMKRSMVEQRLASAIRICQIAFELMGSTNYAHHVGEALDFCLQRGVLLADVHLNNIGSVYREDFGGAHPGHHRSWPCDRDPESGCIRTLSVRTLAACVRCDGLLSSYGIVSGCPRAPARSAASRPPTGEASVTRPRSTTSPRRPTQDC